MRIILMLLLALLATILTLVVAVVLLVLFLLTAFVRIGFIAEYGENGFMSWYKVGFFKFRMSDDDKKSPKRKKVKKPKKKKLDTDKLKEMVVGNKGAIFNTLSTVKKILGRLRRRLLIKELTVYCTFASEDKSKLALLYGRANAGLGIIAPVLKRNFRVKKQDLRVSTDFESDKLSVYAKAHVSIAVWEVFYIIAPVLPLLKTFLFGRFKSRAASA
ncbi:MAG: hypothetical protein FWC13_04295 [Oscillospiraceae bacterium]|nr:hypothetical protein [Oscillospiraceae bacterium]